MEHTVNVLSVFQAATSRTKPSMHNSTDGEHQNEPEFPAFCILPEHLSIVSTVKPARDVTDSFTDRPGNYSDVKLLNAMRRKS